MQLNNAHLFWKLQQKLLPLQNFYFNGINIGIKDKTPDLALASCMHACKAAALFTKNNFPGAPLIVAKEDVFSFTSPVVRAVLVNSKNANVFTGKNGEDDVRTILATLQKNIPFKKSEGVMSSTGIIGKKLPVKKITKALPKLAKGLGNSSSKQLSFANAILTTDSKPKYASAILTGNETPINSSTPPLQIVGIAKGAGMVQPNMATMLVYLFTNIKCKGVTNYKSILKSAANASFQNLSIDGDTSTSDTVLLLNDESSKMPIVASVFLDGLTKVCVNLAQQIISDGEGKHKAIHLMLSGASSKLQASAFAKSILNSLLVKAALHGGDPNWGRIVMAVGKVTNYAVNKKFFSVRFYKHIHNSFFSLLPAEKVAAYKHICKSNNVVEINQHNFENKALLKKAEKFLNQTNIYMEVCIGDGKQVHNFWGNALGEEYIRFNSAYTT